jgi:hypothetical protein
LQPRQQPLLGGLNIKLKQRVDWRLRRKDFEFVGISLMSVNAEFLETLVSMGFDRGTASIALEASVNNFDEAVTFLRMSQPSPSDSHVDIDTTAQKLNQVRDDMSECCCPALRDAIERSCWTTL